MNALQKKYIITTTWILLLTVFLALAAKTMFEGFYSMPAFVHLFVRYDLPAAILSTFILLAGILLALKTKALRIDECLDWVGRKPIKIVFAVFIILSLGAYFVYQRYPLCMDEYMQYFQARIFAEGRLWGQYPPDLIPWLIIPDFFAIFSAETGRVISNYWPGFSLLLTPFMKLRVPWLLNPVIGAGSLLLLFYYMRKILEDSRAASWGILLTISSAVFMVNSISFYSMCAHLFFNLLFAFCLLKITPIRLFLAGLVGSYALVLHNPIPHIAFALPWIIWIAVKEKRFRNIGILLLGYLPLSLIIGVGWYWIQLFVANAGEGAGASPLGVSILAVQAEGSLQSPGDSNLFAFLFHKISGLLQGLFVFPDTDVLFLRLIGWLKTFAWAFPGLPVLAFLGIRYIRSCTHLRLWFWSALSTLFLFLFISFSQGHGWGFRYFYTAWFVLPLLGAAFITSKNLNRAILWKRFVLIMFALSFILGTGLRYFQIHQFIDLQLSQLPTLEKGKQFICFLKTKNGYYLQDMLQNDPFLREDVIKLWYINDKDDMEMMKNRFPNAVKLEDTSLYSVWEVKNKGGETGILNNLNN